MPPGFATDLTNRLTLRVGVACATNGDRRPLGFDPQNAMQACGVWHCRETETAGMESFELCRDDELGYARSRTRFAAGAGLKLDENYRFAHLPLVAPAHPDIIAARTGTRPGATYAMGRHDRTYSLVLPVPGEALARSAAYLDLESELRAAPFARKVAWDVLPRRQAKLHATICGGLGERPALSRDDRRALAGIGPVGVELRGLFSGNINVGRLYLRAYPERRAGANVFQQIQRALGRNETDLYVVGLYNLTDHLDGKEAKALSALLDRWWDRPILRFRADSLWLLGASDDLVLDSAAAEALPLLLK
jgi:hypothetical protein